MVSINIAETPMQPNLRTYGYIDVPDTVKYDGKTIHTPEIDSENLNKMFKFDGQIGGLYRILTIPLRGTQVEIQKPKGRSNREVNFISEILLNNYNQGGMITQLPYLMSTIMRMIIDGWSPHEIVWEIKNGYVRVEKIDYRPIHTISVNLDKRNNITGYTQDLTKLGIMRYIGGENGSMSLGSGNIGMGSNRMDEVMIPADKIMHFINAPEWNPVYGRSLFLQAYFHFEKKHKLYYISHLAAQINALKLRILRSPTDSEDEITKYVELVSKLGFNSTINLPSSWELELLDTGSNFPDILPLIQHHDAQASKSVLAQVLDVGVEGRTGSFNLSDTHFDIFIANLELMANYIANVFNTILIPKLIDWNFGTKLYPTLNFQPFNRQVKTSLFTIYQSLVSANKFNATPEFMVEIERQVADTIGLNVDYDDMEDKVKVFSDILNKEERMLDKQINSQQEMQDKAMENMSNTENDNDNNNSNNSNNDN